MSAEKQPGGIVPPTGAIRNQFVKLSKQVLIVRDRNTTSVSLPVSQRKTIAALIEFLPFGNVCAHGRTHVTHSLLLPGIALRGSARRQADAPQTPGLSDNQGPFAAGWAARFDASGAALAFPNMRPLVAFCRR